ncbi:N-acetylmuramoyl-L-alanine amidase [Larkinella soli]|uniref:N-acetylmuramoyl-L-alanine amidase n=1 Tax=Larkinella soli TaxID=1770527 RepID=UPI000FFBEB2D|nr:peptidoglycan recognition family protein [Larkinella soli]
MEKRNRRFRPQADGLNPAPLLNDRLEALSPGARRRQGIPQPMWTVLPALYLRTRSRPILGIVLHDTAGSGTHDDTLHLARPDDGRAVSADFTVERDGRIWNLNPDLTGYCSLHAGQNTAFRGLRNFAVDQATVGIEIVQHVDLALTPTYPTAQVRKVAWLCAWLATTLGLQPSDIITHRQVTADGSRTDPRYFPFEGPCGFWAYFWQTLGKQHPGI